MKMKAYVHTKTSTELFMAALYIVDQNWKYFRSPSSVDEQIMEYPCSRVQFSNKKEWATDPQNNMNQSQKYYVGQKAHTPSPHFMILLIKCRII